MKRWSWGCCIVRKQLKYTLLPIVCILTTLKISGHVRNRLNEIRNDAICLQEYNVLGEKGPVGKITADMNTRELFVMASDFWWLESGGHHKPRNIHEESGFHDNVVNSNVAVIIPIRDREDQLKILLNNLHPILHRQNLRYSVYVVEQADEKDFNKGLLLNIGYRMALERSNYTCFVFQDVDLIPEDDRIPYGCCRSPMHLSYAIDKFSYSLPDPKLIGGVSAWRRVDFEAVNGWSNLFSNWGGEDDDMSYRIFAIGKEINRMSPSITRYKMIKHKQSKTNENRFSLLSDSGTRYKKDGISSLRYKEAKVKEHALFTRIRVRL
ncbi:beta-1,4-N-acetylgalactosaminyltransferase bre-4-like isoform X2 [Ostrea edulis]|uniref:beta-1,4-N-acetylgalactosaminyltransferase bre-4-like isoform X2 n=1 Tax=Ostrea edulis TaxID=37623 RepID=UPI002094A763|nr:beta-1,4-N-acetylgalactosaminyltransferase bre-4-like isoform X2 [Ostrea edulis]